MEEESSPSRGSRSDDEGDDENPFWYYRRGGFTGAAAHANLG
jgi:hypothetical protein